MPEDIISLGSSGAIVLLITFIIYLKILNP